jgi:hypothetical protein
LLRYRSIELCMIIQVGFCKMTIWCQDFNLGGRRSWPTEFPCLKFSCCEQLIIMVRCQRYSTNLIAASHTVHDVVGVRNCMIKRSLHDSGQFCTTWNKMQLRVIIACNTNNSPHAKTEHLEVERCYKCLLIILTDGILMWENNYPGMNKFELIYFWFPRILFIITNLLVDNNNI